VALASVCEELVFHCGGGGLVSVNNDWESKNGKSDGAVIHVCTLRLLTPQASNRNKIKTNQGLVGLASILYTTNKVTLIL